MQRIPAEKQDYLQPHKQKKAEIHQYSERRLRRNHEASVQNEIYTQQNVYNSKQSAIVPCSEQKQTQQAENAQTQSQIVFPDLIE